MDPSETPREELFQPDELVAGRYRVLRAVARGGMGLVYEAEDTELGGRVALKALRPEIALHKTNLARFRREINLARRVTHPNICRIYDFGQHADSQRTLRFLTMELLHGETLSRFLEREGPLAPEVALPLVAQILSGLAAAHDAAVVHRDFKPSNVLLVGSSRGLRAVITDFGLSAPIEEGQDPSRLTATGQLMGTLAYLAPEQLEGKASTPATDIYAFGCVFYRMMTGVLPFVAGTPLMTALMRLNEDPRPPREIRPQIPPYLESVILRCLRRDPLERFPTSVDVLVALGLDPTRDTTTTMLRPTLAPRPKPAPPPPSRRPWFLLGLAALTAAAAYFAPRLVIPAAEPMPISLAIAPASVEGLEPAATRRLAGVVQDALTSGVDALGLARVSAAVGSAEELVASVAIDGDLRELRLVRRRQGRDGERLSWRLPLAADDTGLRLRIHAALATLYQAEEIVEPGDLLALARLTDLAGTGDTGLPWQAMVDDIGQRRLRVCAQRTPACLEAYLLEARLSRYLGRRTEQLALVERAFTLTGEARQLFAGNPQPILTELDLALRARDAARADAALKALETLSPEFAWAPLLGRAMGSRTCSEWSTALRLTRDHALLSTDRYRNLLIRLLIDARCDDEALEQVRIALEQDPGNLLALEFRAELAIMQGHYAQAQADYQRLLATPLGRHNWSARGNLGMAKLFSGDYAAAVVDFAAINRDSPGDPTMLLNEADARLLLGETESAQALYRQLLAALDQSGPLSPRAMALKAQGLAQLGEHAAAAELVDKMLSLAPDEAQILYSAALVATLGGNHRQARRLAQRSRSAGMPASAFDLPFFQPRPAAGGKIKAVQ
jgi:Tfp pilus assembly protein PilF